MRKGKARKRLLSFHLSEHDPIHSRLSPNWGLNCLPGRSSTTLGHGDLVQSASRFVYDMSSIVQVRPRSNSPSAWTRRRTHIQSRRVYSSPKFRLEKAAGTIQDL